MKRIVRWVVAAALVAAAIVVLAPLASSALNMRRVRGAEVSFCGASVAAKPAGSWIRLTRCGVDMFHEAFLEDSQGKRTHRIVPLRPPDGSAQEPSTLALAVPIESSGEPAGFRMRPGSHSAVSAVADLDETTAVVLGPLDRIDGKLAPNATVEPGVAPNATVLEMRGPASLGALKQRLAIAAGLLVLGIAVLFARGAGSRRDVYAVDERRPVRWGLVFVLVLVGTIALGRGILWYFDPIRNVQSPAPQDVAALQPAPTSPAAPSGPATAALPAATREELALLESASPENRMSGAKALRTRAVTPELLAAVDAALSRNPDEQLKAQLVCIKAAVQGEGSLDFLLSRFPSDRKSLDWNLAPDVACVLDALATRINEAPERISAALMPAVYATNGSTRNRVLGAFKLIDIPIPVALAVEASNSSSSRRRDAVAAAVALGAVRKHPGLVDAAIRDEEVRSAVVTELRSNPHPNAARIVAGAWLDRNDPTMQQLARNRETEQNDVSAALLEVALDGSQSESRRAAAVRYLGVLGDVGPIHDLRRLAASGASGDLKTALDGTIATLARHQTAGSPPRMRALPPK